MAAVSHVHQVFENNFIDLTQLDDSEDDLSPPALAPSSSANSSFPRSHAPPSISQINSTFSRNGRPAPILPQVRPLPPSNPGLILDDSFTRSISAPGDSSLNPFEFQPGDATASSTSFTKAGPISRQRPPIRPQSTGPVSVCSHQNPAKRQRIGTITSVKEPLLQKERTTNQISEDARLDSQDGNTTQPLDGTLLASAMETKELRSRLEPVLRNQILPLISRCLSCHQALDDTTKRQISRKVAAELCCDAAISLLARNESRLSEASEQKIVSKAVRLVGKYMKDRVLPPVSSQSLSRRSIQHFGNEGQNVLDQVLEDARRQTLNPFHKPSHCETVIDLDISEEDGPKPSTSTMARPAYGKRHPQAQISPNGLDPVSGVARGSMNLDSSTSEDEDEDDEIDTDENSITRLESRNQPELILPPEPTQNKAQATNNTQSSQEIRIGGPPSSFILYRKDKVKIVARQNPGLRNWELSPIISAMWAKESPEVKMYYKGCVEDLRRQILEKYPDWKPFRKKRIAADGTGSSESKTLNPRSRPKIDYTIPGLDDESLYDAEDEPMQDDTQDDSNTLAVSTYETFLARQTRQRKQPGNQYLPISRGSTDNQLRRDMRTQRRSALDSSKQLVEQLRLSGHHRASSRPYLSFQARADIERGLLLVQRHHRLSKDKKMILDNAVIHVDFDATELHDMGEIIHALHGTIPASNIPNSKYLEELMLGRSEEIPTIVHSLRGLGLLPRRLEADVAAFLQDAVEGHISGEPRIQRIQLADQPLSKGITLQLSSVLRSREICGQGRCGGNRVPIGSQLKNLLEDSIYREAEWTDCSGDIVAITWLPNGHFVCGAITHSDAHNQQYNKPGNLIVGSVRSKNMVSVSGHQIPRPIVQKGQNALASMRQTQDPWLYSSVSSTAYDPMSNKCYTASYDRTVKIWECSLDSPAMELCGTWQHGGNINFVITSPHHNLIATAADVSRDAVRVYHYNPADASASHYDVYSGIKADEQVMQQGDSTQKWAYYPATIAWGKSPSVTYLLLVGYSPRSLDCEESDIPDDKLNTGELCLWNVNEGSGIQIATARTQNVFEVAWHPTLPLFFAATSAAGDHEFGVRTQIRVFTQTELGTFMNTKTLDCPAVDINELTVRPNSMFECYVTASCTDGSTYVWDTALDEKPIHVLCHGDSIDDSVHGTAQEDFDAGVKFAAWGRTLDRFYTGSSDGVVKAWNVRASAGEAFLHDIVSLSGGISAGAFSPDFSKLIVGDATGKVHLLAIEGSDSSEEPEPFIRKPIVPHAEPPRPTAGVNATIEVEPTAKDLANRFLERGEIVIHPDRYIGAIQGPNYASTGLFCPEGHVNSDPLDSPLEQLQEAQYDRYYKDDIRFRRSPQVRSSNQLFHEQNQKLDLNVDDLDIDTIAGLKKDSIDFRFDTSADFDFEPPVGSVFNEIKVEMDSSENKETHLEESPVGLNHYLNESEVQEFKKLKKSIQIEVKIQTGLSLIKKELDSK